MYIKINFSDGSCWYSNNPVDSCKEHCDDKGNLICYSIVFQNFYTGGADFLKVDKKISSVVLEKTQEEKGNYINEVFNAMPDRFSICPRETTLRECFTNHARSTSNYVYIKFSFLAKYHVNEKLSNEYNAYIAYIR